MPDRLTILHTEASDGWGGQEIRILTESRWMRKNGHKVVIAGPKTGSLFQRALEDGFETVAVPFVKGTQPRDLIRMVGLMKRLTPDVVATHSSVDSWVGLIAARLCGISCVVRYRHVSTPVRKSAVNGFLYRKLCDHVITTAEAASRCLRTDFRLSGDKVSTIATGIAPPETQMGRQEARIRICGELGLPAATRFIGCVAVLRSWKGHDWLMDSFQLLADSHPDVHLLVVGDGPIRRVLLEKRGNTTCPERIHLIGHRDDPWPYHRGAEAIVLASTRNEGIPQSLLQAMLAETPVIGTGIGGIPEVVSPGITGFLVQPGDVRELSGAMKMILDRACDLEEMTSRALAMVQGEYSVEGMGQRVLSVFRRQLDRTRLAMRNE